MLLENKIAVIYGAGGPIGGAVARALSSEARVFLAGRTLASLDKVADEIRSNGGWFCFHRRRRYPRRADG